MKTSELQGAALDWAVAMCEGLMEGQIAIDGVTRGFYKPSTDWAQGGPIIEREDISFRKYHNPDNPAHGTYYARVCRESGEKIWWHKTDMKGPTPLIAAMRCYVASKLGNEIELPEELK